jgi:hypothetical protein
MSSGTTQPTIKGPDRAFSLGAAAGIHLIQLLYRPSNILNPIERLWAVLHQYV